MNFRVGRGKDRSSAGCLSRRPCSSRGIGILDRFRKTALSPTAQPARNASNPGLNQGRLPNSIAAASELFSVNDIGSQWSSGQAPARSTLTHCAVAL